MNLRMLAATAVLLTLPACACMDPHRPPPPRAANPATADYMQEMHMMNADMHRMPPTNNTSRDFVMMMKPHHEAAVEMARTYLQYGHDPELRKMARAIIAGQTKEIAEMEHWEARHGM